MPHVRFASRTFHLCERHATALSPRLYLTILFIQRFPPFIFSFFVKNRPQPPPPLPPPPPLSPPNRPLLLYSQIFFLFPYNTPSLPRTIRLPNLSCPPTAAVTGYYA